MEHLCKKGCVAIHYVKTVRPLFWIYCVFIHVHDFPSANHCFPLLAFIYKVLSMWSTQCPKYCPHSPCLPLTLFLRGISALIGFQKLLIKKHQVDAVYLDLRLEECYFQGPSRFELYVCDLPHCVSYFEISSCTGYAINFDDVHNKTNKRSRVSGPNYLPESVSYEPLDHHELLCLNKLRVWLILNMAIVWQGVTRSGTLSCLPCCFLVTWHATTK